MTHTYALLEVTPMAFAEIQRRLEVAGYDPGHAELDMHGLALVPLKNAPVTDIQIGVSLTFAQNLNDW